MIIKFLDKYRAKFTPKRTDDIDSSIVKFINDVGIFQAAFIIEQGKYKGEWAMVNIDKNDFVLWIPDSDLTFIEKL